MALVNVLDLQAGGLGQLGDEQLEWLEADVKGLGADTPIVVFAHIPLWTVYPQWGWGTSDSERALGISEALRFGDSSKRSHPSSASKGRRQRDFSYRDVDRFPATRARNCAIAWPNESAG